MDRYVVIGNPVAHSLSPTIHARFAAAEGEPVEYERMEVPVGGFAIHARRFFDEGGAGANVTLPFKVDAFEWADAVSARAERAGAANFLARRGARIEADNTDGAGLVADLTRNLGLGLEGQRILVLGAGGAVRGIIAPLLELAPASIVIANRTAARARELAQRFGAPVSGIAIEDIPRGGHDLVLNGTSSGTRGEDLELPAHALEGARFAYDMAYGAGARPFVQRAGALGVPASDGLGMLVEQAAESWFLWRGRRPQTRVVLAELRARVP